MQAPAAEEEKFEDAAEASTEEGPRKEKSRFAYQTLVSEPEAAAAPSRGKDGHLTLSGMGRVKASGVLATLNLSILIMRYTRKWCLWHLFSPCQCTCDDAE
jgi:hypothetical protein